LHLGGTLSVSLVASGPTGTSQSTARQATSLRSMPVFPSQYSQAYDKGHSARYDFAIQGPSGMRYDVWRDYDPEDCLRFYASRMREADLIKSNPKKLIDEHTDWRFLDEFRRELKSDLTST
jgi:NitT/TauT family transport system substrate-binding protein